MTTNDSKPTNKLNDSSGVDYTKPTRHTTNNDNRATIYYPNDKQSNKSADSNILMIGLKQLIVAALYVLLGTVIHHYFTNQGIGILWPANGLALAVVLIGGRHYIWGVLLGSVLLHIPFKESFFVIGGISFANAIQVLVGSWLLTYNDRSVLSLHTLRDYLRLITLGGFIASMMAAIIVAGILLLSGFISSADYFTNVMRWWMGNSLGIVLVTPLILAWWQKKSDQFTGKQQLEALLLVGITFIAGQIIFLGWLNNYLIVPPKAFIMLLPITIIAIKLGIRSTTLVLNIIAIQALLGAYLQTGYFANEIATAHLYNYWLYVLILSGIGMALTTYVNELKQKELSLRKSESQLRLSQTSGGIGSWEVDLITNKLMWSESCRALIGLDHEPTYDDFLNALYPEDRQRVLNAIQSHIEHGTKYEVEYRAITTNGNIRWVRCSGQVERDAKGKPLIMRGIAQDITEHRHNQQRIERLLEEQRAILENRLIGIATVRNRNIVWANPAYEIMLGYCKGETVGVAARQFYAHEQDYQAVQNAYQNSESIIRTQHQLLRKDGRTIWVDVSRTLLHKETGESLLIFIDVTERKRAERALQQKERYQRALLDNFPFIIWLKDTQSRFLAVNQNLAKTFGESHPDKLLGKTDFDYSPKELAEKYQQDDRLVLASKKRQTIEEQIVNHLGERLWIETFKAPVVDDNGALLGTVGFSRNISDRKKIEADLRIAAIAFESQEGMFITDANNIILRVNSAFTQITGYTPEDVIGKDPSQSKSGIPDIGFYQAISGSILRTGKWNGEILNRRKNGEVYPAHLTITAVQGADKRISHYVSTLTDITIKKAAENEIERLAFYDPLTNLPNRRLLLDRLKKALASSARNGLQGALLFIDLDNFKTLNDTLGHNIGDLLLQQVAARLTNSVREDDTVARLGGDEFVIMLENLSPQSIEAATQTEMIGEKILMMLNQSYLLAKEDYHITASIGVTLFNNNQQSIEELLKQADIAMYQAKTAGRNTLRFFDLEMQAKITTRVALEADLRSALADKQFQLYYQPQVYHDKIIGAEVLIRWPHPQRGMVAPVHFIPLAEEIGLIVPIGQWVLETACAQIKKWEDNEHTQHLQLAVNVSARQFRQADFVEQVCQVISHSAIKPDRLKLELTESLVLDNITDTIEKMNALRKIDVRFSMDDFGTGYSSLAYLTQLPLDQLKIDQSFIRNIGVKPADAVIVQTIIGMANNLGMEVIAEGVETEEQRAFLKLHDCPLYQGYLFAKPIPITEFELLLKDTKGSA